MQTKISQPTPQQIKAAENWGIWEKEVSEFPWEYDAQETCYILEGEADVVEADGAVAHFGVGDWVVFPAGLKCTWKITQPIKKKYSFH